jgi:hypothetical protein
MLQESKSQHEHVPLQSQEELHDNFVEHETELLNLEEQIEVEAQSNRLEVSNIMISKNISIPSFLEVFIFTA